MQGTRSELHHLLAIDVASMTKGDNNHQQDVVLDCIDNPIIANRDPKTRTAAQGNCFGRPGIGPKECDSTVDTFAIFGMDLVEGPKGRGT